MKLNLFKINNNNFILLSYRAYSSSLESEYEYLKEHTLLLKRKILGGKAYIVSSSELKPTTISDYIYYIVYGCSFSNINEFVKDIPIQAYTLDITNHLLNDEFKNKIFTETLFLSNYNYSNSIIDVDIDLLNKSYIDISNNILSNYDILNVPNEDLLKIKF